MTPAEKRRTAMEYARSRIYRMEFLPEPQKQETLITVADIYLEGMNRGIEVAEKRERRKNGDQK